jgi:hypothetical protein
MRILVVMSAPFDAQLEGLEVFDVDGTKVGKVVQVDKVLGYFETLGTFYGPRYIPFFAVERIDPAGIHLNVMKSVVTHVYNHTPGVRPALAPGDTQIEGGTVPSGYTGQAVPLDADALRAVRGDVFIGATVLDVDDKNLGTLQAFDADTGYMRIEKDGFIVKDIFLPVTSVSFVDELGIHLSEAKSTLSDRYRRRPDIARGFYGR